MFDWLRFLQSHNIDYVTSGSSVVRGNVAVHCPLCGRDDPSHHMGISLHGKGWGCWRSKAHRGISPVRLICALIQCTTIEAQKMVEGGVTPTAGIDRVSAVVNQIRHRIPRASSENSWLAFPSNIKPLTGEGMGKHFVNYLVNRRGYTPEEVDDLAEVYGLRYAFDGPFGYRIVFPVHGIRKLMTWTGRAINDGASIRYLTLSSDKERAERAGLPQAMCSIKELLWNLPVLLRQDYHKCLICEGPLDALRVDYYGRHFGLRATCTFGKIVSVEQIEWLRNLYAERRDVEFAFLFDRDADLDAQTVIFSQLRGFGRASLPRGVKDPALLEKSQIMDLTDFAYTA